MPRSYAAPLNPNRAAPTFGDVVRFAASYWRRQPGRLTAFLILMIVASAIETNLPNALSAFLAKVRQRSDADTVCLYLALFIGNYFAQVLIRTSAFVIYNAFETRTFKAVFDDAFTHAHRLSEQFFTNTFAGSIISRITRARGRIETFEDQILVRIMPTMVILIGSICFMALRFPLLALLVSLYLIVLLGASAMLVLRVVGPSQSAYAAAQDRMTAHLADSISSIATTRAFAQEEREVAGFAETTEQLRHKNHRAYNFGNAVGFVQQLLLGGMLVLLLGGGTWYFLHGQTGVEDIAYLTLAYTIIQSYLRELSFNIKDLLTASYDLHAVIDLMRQEPGIKDIPNAKSLVITKGEITFDHVTFTYQGKQDAVFENFSLTIKAGERVALVGHSGSGKTSFVRLIQRLYDVESGSIRIDGQDIRQGTQASLRSAIAGVPQDPILFHRSLRDNIAYGMPDATLEQIYGAAKQAHIHDFILSLPLRYETLVGERGIKLSGGERQRVAIARAILADRPILILDEATSSLDSVSEKAIQDALHVLTHGRTSIMVAHRLSTILDADRILVFEAGRIIEEGTHTALMAKENGVYAGFFKLQSGGFISD